MTKRTPLVRVELVRERSVTYEVSPAVQSPEDLVSVARALIGDSDREVMAVIYLNHKHKVQAIERVATGTLSSVVVHPREVFKGALLANASAIAMVHNHPSGDPTPSEDDRELTKRVMQAGEILGIRVLDHIVLGEDKHVSLRETTTLWHQNQFHA